MKKSMLKRIVSLLLTISLVLGTTALYRIPAYAAALTTSVEGLTASYTNGSWTANGTSLSGSATGTAAGSCSEASSVTSTLTLTNNKGSAAVLSFTYARPTLGSGGSVTVDGTAVTAAGTLTKTLPNGSSVTVVIVSGSAGANTSSIDISNLSLVTEKTVTVTFLPAAEGGSYTVDGRSITSSWENTQVSTQAYSLTAVPASGYKLLGWHSSRDGYISAENSFSRMFEYDQTIRPVFTNAADPVFDAGGVWYADLNAAVDHSVSANVSKITLLSSGTLPAGEYIIPAGKILLIPYEGTGIVSAAQPDTVKAAPTTPSEFRKLTLASGAVLTVTGSVCVNARQNSTNNAYTGVTTGPYGHVSMSAGSQMILRSGANLYCWGYISGSGEITAESGAKVYEPFQICDIRGGTATSGMNGNSQKVLPFTQYYIQNIEVPMTLEYGALETVVGSITIQNNTSTPGIQFVGNSGAMFTMAPGSTFRKSYDPVQDRVSYDVSGSASVNSISMNIYISVDSSKYVMPIMENTSIAVHSGTVTVDQDLCMIPGSRITVDNGATVKIAGGRNVYVYDRDEWIGGNFVYPAADLKTSYYSPVRTDANKFSAAQMVDAQLDLNGTMDVSGQLFTTVSGADITSSGGSGKMLFTAAPASSATTYQARQSNTDITYQAISATAPRLHNTLFSSSADEYTATAGASAGEYYSYCKLHGVWEKGDPHEEEHVHEWGPPAYTWAEDNSTATAARVCIHDESHVDKETVKTTYKVKKAPDCEHEGTGVYTAAFTNKAFMAQTKEVPIPALGHDFALEEWKWTGSEAEGYTAAEAYFICRHDKNHSMTVPAELTVTAVEDKVIYTAVVTMDGKTYKDRKEILSGIGLDRTELLLRSDDHEQLTAVYLGSGMEVSDAVWSSSDESVVKVDENGRLTPVKAGFASVTAEKNGFTENCMILVLFDDVQNPDKYYYTPVYRAVKDEITTGVADFEFAPEDSCTREQIVTFLWRVKGKPKAETDMGFSDVKPGKWYTEAINWAAGEGITTGYNGTAVFGVGDKCTREQVVTFLWRAAGSPEPESESSFRDVKADAYYAKAVAWAAEQEITQGVDAEHFGVGSSCSRGQIVTFLQRYANPD